MTTFCIAFYESYLSGSSNKGYLGLCSGNIYASVGQDQVWNAVCL
jgi:hypothetical protein